MSVNVERLKVGLQEIAAMTGESMPVIHDAINAGHLATFLVGRRRFSRPDAVRKWVDYLEQQSNQGTPIKYRARSLKTSHETPNVAGGKV